MQRLPRKIQKQSAIKGIELLRRPWNAPEIDRIAHDRVPFARQMNPDLMGAPGGQPAREQADRHAMGGQCPVMCERVAPSPADDGHAFAVPRIPADIALNVPLHRTRHPPGERQVGPVQIPRGKGCRQSRQRQLGLGHDHHAGRVLVQPMHDPRPTLAADPRKPIAAVRQQRDQANDQLAQAMAQNAKLTRDLDKAKSDLKASDEALDAKDE